MKCGKEMEDLKKSIIDDSNACYETEYMLSTNFFSNFKFPNQYFHG
jgi:hypothetical protein